jgi:hypothetical protein
LRSCPGQAAVCDLVLDKQQFEQVLARHGHEKTFGQMQANLLLEVVCLMLEAVDLVTHVRCLLPVATRRGRKKRAQFFRASVGEVDLFLEWLDR